MVDEKLTLNHFFQQTGILGFCNELRVVYQNKQDIEGVNI